LRSLWFAALEYLDSYVESNRAWEMSTENIKISARENIGYYELRKHKVRFEEGCPKLLDQRKHSKLQLLQDPREISRDDLNSVRREANRYFRNKKREYLKDKINELATNSKNKNIKNLNGGLNEFQIDYNPRNKLMMDEKGVLLADSHNIVIGWMNYFSQLLNVYNVGYIRQTEVHTAEPLVRGPSRLENEISIAKLKKYKSPGSDEISAELIQGGGETLVSATNSLIPFGIRKNCLIRRRSQVLHQFTERMTNVTIIIIVGYHCYQLHTKVSNILLSLLFTFSASVMLEKKLEYN
jgi:hypothetical protein